MRKWIESKLKGHWSCRRLTVYGANAMHYGVTFWTRRWGYICFRLPIPCFGRWWPLYFYLSPNATPWAATFYLGDADGVDSRLAIKRRQAFGHGFCVDDHYDELSVINGYASN